MRVFMFTFLFVSRQRSIKLTRNNNILNRSLQNYVFDSSGEYVATNW